MLNIYDLGWMEILAQRQEDYFYNTAAPVLTDLFEQVAMRAEMKPFDFEELKKSKKYLSILKTSIAMRKEQVYYHEGWKESLGNIENIIMKELNKVR